MFLPRLISAAYCAPFFSLLLWVKSGKTLIAKIKTLQYSQHLLFHHQLLKLEYRFTTLYLPKIYAQYRRQSEFLTITRSETTNNNWTTNILPKQLCINCDIINKMLYILWWYIFVRHKLWNKFSSLIFSNIIGCFLFVTITQKETF